MLNGQKIVVVMPAYNAARTLRQTYDEVMVHGIVDLVIVVDDASRDETVVIARTLPNVQVEVHPENRGTAQPKDLLPPRAGCRCRHHHYDSSRLSVHTPVDSGDGGSGREWSLSLRTRFADSRRRRTARRHAVVEIRFKPVPHAGGESSYRRETIGVSHWLSRIFAKNSWNVCHCKKTRTILFLIIKSSSQIVALGCAIGEVTCPARYMPEASSINFRRSVRYGLGCLATAVRFRLMRWGLVSRPLIISSRRTRTRPV